MSGQITAGTAWRHGSARPGWTGASEAASYRSGPGRRYDTPRPGPGPRRMEAGVGRFSSAKGRPPRRCARYLSGGASPRYDTAEARAEAQAGRQAGRDHCHLRPAGGDPG